MSASRLQRLLDQAVRRHQAGDLAGAEGAYRQILAETPRHAEALRLLGMLRYQRGDAAQAIEFLTRAVVERPDEATYLAQLGLALGAGGRPEEAIARLRAALERAPDSDDTRYYLAQLLIDTERGDEALVLVEDLLARRPDNVELHFYRGVALELCARYAEAATELEPVVAGQPDWPPGFNALGLALRGAGDAAGAAQAFERAVALDPKFDAAWLNLSALRARMGDHAGALDLARHAVALAPSNARAHASLGRSLAAVGDFPGAATAYLRATELDPAGYRNLEALHLVCQRLGRVADVEPLVAARLGAAKVPDAELAAFLSLKRTYCQWQGLASGIERLAELVRTNEAIVFPPFAALHLFEWPAVQRAVAERMVKVAFGGIPTLPPRAPSEAGAHGLLHIGYLSADFREHPVADLVADVLGLHDRTAVRVSAYAVGRSDPDPVRERISRSVDAFVDLAGLSDEAAAQRIRDDRVDILVDLTGHTAEARTGILARRPAPVQASWLGYAGTTGAQFIDYLVADPIVIPAGAEGDYTEQVVRLPACYMPIDRSRTPLDAPSRASLGLPADAVVLASFNQSYKLTPDVFAVWLDALAAEPAAVLWLRGIPSLAQTNLRAELARRGLAPERLVFAPRVDRAADHLARYHAVDLALDTFPYGSHATAMDALWVGCPVLTLAGETFASRVAASQLGALGLRELITQTIEGYREQLLRLVADRDALASLRSALAAARETSPLFDMPAFTRELERAYREMWSRHAAGEAAAGFDVAGLRSGATRSA